ncbi:unnamed protein product [Rotaria sp. Silwood2]|nr:unnamed protein product [Rotaria sp. Silwood2]CAF3004794.1 unnamed protein product [Rotaria sp. Silwood2]CAF3351501.1 unnamed protein product [Rotaria sp. Silwood2]CAF4102796.1 unnamed protein product [Rotaria sp. Silwood2]CAF4201994.1 unnamed protein product [Rotaria sp. Silwood2]
MAIEDFDIGEIPGFSRPPLPVPPPRPRPLIPGYSQRPIMKPPTLPPWFPTPSRISLATGPFWLAVTTTQASANIVSSTTSADSSSTMLTKASGDTSTTPRESRILRELVG